MSAKLKQVKNWPELARQARWSAKAIAEKCGISEGTLRRHFIKEMGMPPKAWLAKERQHAAMELLKAGLLIKEAAFLVGYKKNQNFSRKYKQNWGASPSKHLNEVRGTCRAVKLDPDMSPNDCRF
jgi:transcriptional regulator GlxA family with amidase domain